MTPEPISRRLFVQGSAASLSLWLGGSALLPQTTAQARSAPERGRVIDCHAHCQHPSAANYLEKDRQLIEAADKLGIDQLCASILTPKRPASVEGFRECNRSLLEVCRRYPGRILGYCYVNPGHSREALDEVRRYVEEHGFIGVKLYNEHRCNDPIVFPLVELTIELKVPILEHAGHAHYPLPAQPNISDGSHLAELARHYPEATLICAHVGGGGDWEWTIKSLRSARSVYLDTSGSVTDDGMVDMAAKILGVDRLLFGCDMSMTAGVGKIRAAHLTAEEKRRILGDNMQRILAKRSGA